MGKFKGTKGKWKFVGGDNASVEINIGETTATFDRSDKNTGEYVISREEMNANGKLASFAPELLEALQHTLDVLYLCDCPNNIYETYANLFMNYNNLIKEATEL